MKKFDSHVRKWDEKKFDFTRPDVGPSLLYCCKEAKKGQSVGVGGHEKRGE